MSGGGSHGFVVVSEANNYVALTTNGALFTFRLNSGEYILGLGRLCKDG